MKTKYTYFLLKFEFSFFYVYWPSPYFIIIIITGIKEKNAGCF